MRLPKEMKSVCDQLQKVWEEVLESESLPTSDLALVVSPLHMCYGHIAHVDRLQS